MVAGQVQQLQSGGSPARMRQRFRHRAAGRVAAGGASCEVEKSGNMLPCSAAGGKDCPTEHACETCISVSTSSCHLSPFANKLSSRKPRR